MGVDNNSSSSSNGCGSCWSGAIGSNGRAKPTAASSSGQGRGASVAFDERNEGDNPDVTLATAAGPRRKLSTLMQNFQLLEIKLQNLLDKGWLNGVGRQARGELEEMLTIVRQMEIEESESSSRPKSTLFHSPLHCQRRNTPLFSLRDEVSGPGRNEHTELMFGKTMTDSRRWLVETFTTEQVEDSDSDSGSEGGPLMVATATRRRNTENIRSYIDMALEQAEVHRALELDAQLGFDAVAFAGLKQVNGHPLQCIGAHLVQNGLISSLQGKVPESNELKFETTLVRFLGHIDELYKHVPYHSAAHAADILMTTRWFSKSEFLMEQMTGLDRFIAMVAAAIHDVGHPGRNNEFMKRTSPLAQTYYEDGILEHMHLSKAFEAMSKHQEVNWLSLLPRKSDSKEPGMDNLQNYVRRGLIEMVLATDMAKHDYKMRRLHSLVDELTSEQPRPQLGGVDVPVAEWEYVDRKFFILGEILHAADISNPVKPRPVMLKWTARVSEEFWSQGDEEKVLGLDISPMCDRESGMKSVPKGQMGFINFVIAPFYNIITRLIPETSEAVDQMNENLAFWKEQDAKGATIEDFFNFEDEKNGHEG
mmetsp:Transcript_56398/g.123226  ORF Transcript_56398/g.123226 Transcript_56398/m.123226 type:complete len:592 (-) Transcript_56398:175-1950(-)